MGGWGQEKGVRAPLLSYTKNWGGGGGLAWVFQEDLRWALVIYFGGRICIGFDPSTTDDGSPMIRQRQLFRRTRSTR